MQKVFVAILAAAMLQFAAPAVPAHAASLDQRVSDFIMQNPNLLQEVIELKQDLAEGNKNTAINKVVAAVVANNNEIATAVAENGELITAAANGNLTEVVSAQFREGVEAKVREEVEKRVGDKLPAYQSQISTIAKLLNWQTPLDSTTDAENSALDSELAN